MSQTLPRLSKIGMCKVFGETTFGSDASANGVYMRTLPFALDGLTVNSIRDGHMRQADLEVARILGAYTGQITTVTELHGWSSSVPTDVTALKDATDNTGTIWDQIAGILGSAFGNFMGGSYEDGTVSKSGTPTDTITVDEATGDLNGLSNFGAGQPICWATGSYTLPYYIGWLTGINTAAAPDEGTLLQTTPPYDPQGSAVWGAHPLVWTPRTPELDAYAANGSNGGVANGAGGAALTSPAKAWTIDSLGHGSDDRVVAYGCQPVGVKWSFPIAEVSRLETTWGVAHWEVKSSGGEPAIATWAMPSPEPCRRWYCAWGATAASSLPLKGLEIDLGLTRNDLVDGAAASGIGGRYTVKRTPTVSFSVHRDYSEEITDFEAQTGKPFTFQQGTQPGKMVAICVPNARVVEYPTATDDNEAKMSQVTLEAHDYTGDTGSASETTPVDSPFRLAFV